MAQFYKIQREDLEIFIKYNPQDETVIQLIGNNIVLSRGKMFGWQDSTKDEFDIAFQKIMKKLQDYLKK